MSQNDLIITYPAQDEQALDVERPQHRVTLTHGFEMCRYACTQGLYESAMGTNPSGIQSLFRTRNPSKGHAVRDDWNLMAFNRTPSQEQFTAVRETVVVHLIGILW